jgi:hypothetical protein
MGVTMWEAKSMEKRIAGIIRWLERCLKAYKTGALESALMDAECARADVELLRDEVWKKLEKRYAAKTQRWGAWLPVKAAFLAVLAVLAAATPLFENTLPEQRTFRERQDTRALEWVTPDEKTLLSNLRKHLSDSNSFASSSFALDLPFEAIKKEAKEETEETGSTKAVVPAKKNAAARKTSSPEPGVGVKIKGTQEAQRIPYDRILSLVQTGEKAMKHQASIITIEKQ